LLMGTALLSTSGLSRDRAEEGPAERGPGAAFHMFVLMEDLLDKLKLLSYEEEALRRHNMVEIEELFVLCITNLSSICVQRGIFFLYIKLHIGILTSFFSRNKK
uniref:Intraflagellar transport protein 57 homolog n=1 Tax=Catharus ustulatus TaxID=91951 RepID=A0A8C3TQF1_CATUS